MSAWKVKGLECLCPKATLELFRSRRNWDKRCKSLDVVEAGMTIGGCMRETMLCGEGRGYFH